jgi:hypothetical protein
MRQLNNCFDIYIFLWFQYQKNISVLDLGPLSNDYEKYYLLGCDAL